VRVALVSPYSLSVPGGAQGQVLGLSGALADLGHEVAVLGPLDGPRREWAARASALGASVAARVIPVGRAVSVPVNGSLAPVSPWPSTMARTVQILRGGAYDVVHLHEPFVPGPSLAALTAGPRPLVATYHRAGIDAAYRGFGLSLGRLRRRLAAAVAVSEEARSTALKVIGGRPEEIEVLWNGVDVARWRRAEPAPSKVPAIVFVGRHEQRKGLVYLLEAFSMLAPPDLALWVCGLGPETAGLRERFAGDERVEWLGRVSDAEAASRVRGATVFCAPAVAGESFGLVVAEAMAAGTPVVASDIPGYRAALAGAGVLVPPGDAAALAAALGELLGDQQRREALSAAGRARAEQLSLEALAERYVELYSRAAAVSMR
jgi:phosphatidyl-myo-inositol alpha-mannosyltransferase